MEVLYLQDQLTTSVNSDNLLTALARANCLNLSNEVDFNKYGVKDNIGLTTVGESFIDCFIVQLKNQEEAVDHVRNLRILINTHGMMQASILTIDNDKFKIACPDYDISMVINFMRSLKTTNFKLNCIDITQDYAGSFDKAELKRHLMEKCGFVEESFISKSHPTIINRNDDAHTCLQYWNGKSLRCKVYLKMPEILQSKNVRANVGNRWLSWILKNNRLAKSRDASANRGLTRVEVTSYMDENNFDYDPSTLLSLISDVTQYLNPELIYSTPHSAMWSAYCDCFKHTLIISNPQFGATPDLLNDTKVFPPGRALLVYSFNCKTKDISGRFINNWNAISKHAIERHTLSAKLPVDIIELCTFQKILSAEQGRCIEIHVTRNRYIKSDDKPLYLTKDHTLFNSKCYTQEENEKYLTQAGFIAHKNCTVSLPVKAHKKFSKTVTHLQLNCPEEDIKCNIISKKVNSIKNNLQQLKLSDLPIGVYDIKKITTRKSTYGRYVISIDYQGEITTITSNKILDACIPTQGIKEADDNSTVAQIRITQKKRDHNRNCIVNAELIILE